MLSQFLKAGLFVFVSHLRPEFSFLGSAAKATDLELIRSIHIEKKLETKNHEQGKKESPSQRPFIAIEFLIPGPEGSIESFPEKIFMFLSPFPLA